MNAVYHFTFTGKEEKQATVTIRDGTLQVQDGHQGEADLRVTADSETWLGFLAKERSLLWALLAPAHPHQGVAEAAGRLRQVFSLVSKVRPRFPRQPSRQEQDMNTFTNKVVVITGGNSGMGLAAAQEFSRRGAKVVISGRDEKTLAEAAASIGGDTLAVRADVSRLADLDNLFARTKKQFGSIDVLFVNAGIAKFAPFEQTTEAMLRRNPGHQLQGGVLHGPESAAAAQGRRGHCHQHVGCVRESHAERQRLCGEQGGAAVVDPDAGGGTARSQESG